jgi:hypothetical protein
MNSTMVPALMRQEKREIVNGRCGGKEEGEVL